MRLEDVARLDLNRLVVLAVILEERGVSRAARRLRRTQSAVSHTLAELRRELNDELLVRSGGGFVPTAYAEGLEAPLRSLLGQLGALGRPTGFDPATSRRSFRVGWSDYLQVVLGGAWIPAVRAAAPGVDLEAIPPGPAGPAPLLADGRLDLGFDVGLTDAGDLRGRLLFDDAFVAFAGERVSGDPTTLEGYVAAPHLLVAPLGGTSGPVDRALATLGLRRRIAVRNAHFLGAVDQVRHSDLVTTLPRRVLLALGAPQDRMFAPPIPLAPLRVRAVWHPRSHGDAGVTWLRDTLVDAAVRTGLLPA